VIFLDKKRIVKGRKKGFFTIDNIVIDEIAEHIGPYILSVYMALCRHAHIDTQTCFPSIDLIAKEIGAGPTKVKKSIKQLEELGLIIVDRKRKRDGTRHPNTYTLIDISGWTHPPQIFKKPNTVDISDTQPGTPKYNAHRRQATSKETKINETNNKEVSLKGMQEKTVHITDYRPDCITRRTPPSDE